MRRDVEIGRRARLLAVPALSQLVTLALVTWLVAEASPAAAQPLGTFRWQLSPFCNVLTLAVARTGGIFTLDGTDDRCGAERASVTGTAFINPNGTIGMGLTLVVAPGAAPLHITTVLNIATLGGTWTDSAGHSGTLVFGVPSPAPGTPRPAGGGLGAAAIDPAQVQRRVGACASGTAVRAVNEDGSVVCQPAGNGDVTSVAAGAGLTGGGLDGDVALAVAFGGSGSAATAAHSDHTHARGDDDLSTAIGDRALASLTFGHYNTAVGATALFTFATGHSNTALGAQALENFTSGEENIAIGHGAGQSLEQGSRNIHIGNAGSALDSHTTRIGDIQTRAFISGIRSVTTGVNNAVAVVIDSNRQLGTISSSRRVKEDIADLGPISRTLLDLRPVQFRYRQAYADGSKPLQYGLIAEEVADVLPELVATDENGDPASVKYHVLPTLLLAEIQRLERERSAQSAVIEALQRDLAAAIARVSTLENARAGRR